MDLYYWCINIFGNFTICISFLNPEYTNSFDVYKIYVIGTFLCIMQHLERDILHLINRGIILTYSQVISVVLNIVLNLFLIK